MNLPELRIPLPLSLINSSVVFHAMFYQLQVLPPLLDNDHSTIVIHLKLYTKVHTSIKRMVGIMLRLRFRSSIMLLILPIGKVVCPVNILTHWPNMVLKIAKQHIPKRMVTIRNNDVPW